MVSTHFPNQRDSIYDGDDPILFNVPALLLFLSPHDDLIKERHTAEAAQHVALMATSLGIGSCYSCISVFIGEKIKKPVPHFPESDTICNALIPGYEKHPPKRIPPRKEEEIFWCR